LLIFLIILASCTSDPAVLPGTSLEQPEIPTVPHGGTVIWNGFELVREDFFGRANEVRVLENVLTTEDHELTVQFTSGLGSDHLEFGMMEVIQVNINGVWFSLPRLLNQREQPLVLPPLSHEIGYLSDGSWIEHTVDLSVFGRLPPGRYRLVERFFWERLQTEFYSFAYFWVTEPGAQRPPEAETTGTARLEDILISVRPISTARYNITDRDSMFFMLIENLSGKRYITIGAVLEMKSGGQWLGVEYQHANMGLMFGWEQTRNFLFLNSPLSAGEYRLTLTMSVFETYETIEPEYEFIVIAHDSAPEASWDVSKLTPSTYDATKQSTGVTITLINPIIDSNNELLEFIVTADNYYFFGTPFEIDVLIDGRWYSVPFANDMFTSIGFSVDENTALADRIYIDNPLIAAGALPAGQYRLIKTFDLMEQNASWESPPVFLAKEFAMAEFTVTETLEWFSWS